MSDLSEQHSSLTVLFCSVLFCSLYLSKNETSTLLDVHMSLLVAVNAAKISTYINFQLIT
ncbi:hypothetical protein F3S29_23520 [Vibrio parahaemolyticus]|nr:hypothetical protein [Vibrio parahaemolyticus]